MANTSYYVDPSMAVDEGPIKSNGQAYTPPGVNKKGAAYTPGFIYGTFAAALAAASGTYNFILLRRGFYHAPTPNYIVGVSFLTISDYGSVTLEKPRFDLNQYLAPTLAEDSLWTNNFNGTWSRVFAGTTSVTAAKSAFWAGALNVSNTSRLQGVFKRRAPTLASVDKNAPWYIDPGGPFTVTIWTGSNNVAPPSFYNGIAVNLAAALASPNQCLQFRNSCNDILVSYLTIIGAPKAVVGCGNFTTGGVTNLTFDNITLHSCADGFGYIADNAGVYSILNPRITNLTIDANVTAEGNDTDNTTMNADWITADNNVYGLLVDKFTITTGNCHAALNITNNPTAIPRNFVFSNGTITFITGVNDGRGFGLNLIQNTLVKNVTIVNQASTSELSGVSVRLENVIWKGGQKNIDEKEGRLFLIIESRVPPDSGDSDRLVLEHCVFDQTNSADLSLVTCVGFRCFASAGGALPIDAGAVTIANCLAILKPGGGFVGIHPGVALGLAATVGNQIITNNYVTRPDGAPVNKQGRYQDAVSTWTDELLNGFIGTTSITGTVLAALNITSGYKPNSGSPLIGAGVHLGYRQDSESIQYRNPPTIGAYEKFFT